jgi:myosin heavy subunit
MLLLGILHLGELRFHSVVDSAGDASAVTDRKPLELAASLLGLPVLELESALIKKKSLVIRGIFLYKIIEEVTLIDSSDVVLS